MEQALDNPVVWKKLDPTDPMIFMNLIGLSWLVVESPAAQGGEVTRAVVLGVVGSDYVDDESDERKLTYHAIDPHGSIDLEAGDRVTHYAMPKIPYQPECWKRFDYQDHPEGLLWLQIVNTMNEGSALLVHVQDDALGSPTFTVPGYPLTHPLPDDVNALEFAEVSTPALPPACE